MTDDDDRGRLFRRGHPSPAPRALHARETMVNGTDASEVTERVAQEQRAAEQKAGRRAAAGRTEVFAGEEVPVDLIDAEDLDTGGADSMPAAATPPAPPHPSPSPPATLPPPALPVVEPEMAAAGRPSPVARPIPAGSTRDEGQRQAVDLDKVATEPANDATATSSDGAPDAGPSTSNGSGARFLRRHRRGVVRIVRIVVTLAIAAIVAILLRAYVVQPYYIPSASMEPTLHGCTGCTDDRVIVDKLSYRIHDVHAGDIVVFNKPPNAAGLGIGDDVLIKRVVALGGDTLTLKKDRVYVNGLPDDENYLNRSFLAKHCKGQIALPETGQKTWKIPNDDVFVMGDNRCDSTDSRTFGPIKKNSIIGRAAFIIWPFSRIGGI